MCGSMADIQSAVAEIRRGKKKKERKNKPQHENIMVCPITYGDHNYYQTPLPHTPHSHLAAFCTGFWRSPLIITLVLFIFTLRPLFSTLFFHSLSLLIESYKTDYTKVKACDYEPTIMMVQTCATISTDIFQIHLVNHRSPTASKQTFRDCQRILTGQMSYWWRSNN